MNRKKKNLIMMAVLLGGVLLLTGIYILISGSRKNGENGPEDAEPVRDLTLVDLESDEITSIRISNADFTGTVVRTAEAAEEGAEYSYSLLEDGTFPVNTTTAANLFRYITQTASQFVTEDGVLSEYGLEEPVAFAEVKTPDRSVVIKVGSPAGLTEKGGYYACIEGNGSVFLAQSGLYNVLNYDIKDLLAVDVPNIDTTLITKVVCKWEEGFTLEKNSEKAAGLKTGTETDNETDWVYTDVLGTVLYDENNADAYISDCFYNLSVSEAVDYKEENREKYGLLSPKAVIEVYCEGEEPVIISVGDRFSDDYFYVSFGGDTRTYFMYYAKVEELLSLP